MDIQVMDVNPLYQGETYRLKFEFSNNYPIGISYSLLLLFSLTLASCTINLMHVCFMHAKPHIIFRLTVDLIEPPEVVFIRHNDRPIPIHPHIYTNGIICLDLLASQGWSPVQNVESVCLSIQSMLTGNSKNERPPGDAEFVRTNRLRPRDVAFHFHDNSV